MMVCWSCVDIHITQLANNMTKWVLFMISANMVAFIPTGMNFKFQTLTVCQLNKKKDGTASNG